MENKEKNLKYADLMEKLKKSIRNGFYYEAIFIEYAIFEDRTESLLKHAKYKTTNIDGRNISFNEKLKKIMDYPKFHEKYVSKHITIELLYKIDDWRKKRNKVIHDLINCPYSNSEIKKIALDGNELIKKLNSKSTLVTKYFDNKQQ